MSQATHAYTTDPLPQSELERLRAIRADIEASLTRMLEALDQLDGDPDFEPTMGYLLPGVVDEAQPNPDLVSSMGSLDRASQAFWAFGLGTTRMTTESEKRMTLPRTMIGGGEITTSGTTKSAMESRLSPRRRTRRVISVHWSHGNNGSDDKEADPTDGEQWRLL